MQVLPSVIKSAQVMKKVVAFLLPLMEKGKRETMIARDADPDDINENNTSNFTGKLLMATVKDNVHDIRKILSMLSLDTIIIRYTI